ncbi:GNAT family N-acetyltransferase [Pseudomonas aeruginosa]|uniref:GNAT family N-acetyltransferase n=1 Tax=Pseudomonas aeruginosa TaxID=287 RepID=UPI000B48D07E|nr:GNAT family N-acetyltransferase [Pseudomonas aeruginosa]MCU9245261.1 GNAT family N-acetyltransferase [Pseudomonas aeruginosa]OWJ36510.1 AacA34 family aminoglycoside 6'-N-acetyltransferase [Pseudomonas aeruginosa]
MTVTIRPIDQSDALDWLRLRNAIWEGEDHEREIAAFFRGELEEPVQVLLAVNARGEAVAHVELSLRLDVPGLEGFRTGYIEGMYICPNYRKTGVALCLLRAAEQWAKQQDCAAFASDREDRVVVHSRFRRAA